MNRKLSQILLSLLLLMVAGDVLCGNLDQQRKDFLEAEKLLGRNRSADFKIKLAALEGYPLYPYIEYRWLKRNLHKDLDIQNFLHQYDDTRYSGLLRTAWLKSLARRKQWTQYLRHYQQSDNTALQCLYQWAKYKTGAKGEALIAVKPLWVVGRSQPEECDLIFSKLIKSDYFTEEMIWRRFVLALENGKVQLAKYIRGLFSKKNRAAADYWLRVHQQPSLIKNDVFWKRPYKQLGLIFAHGVDRMAWKDPQKAIVYWDLNKNFIKIDSDRIQKLDQRLALGLAFRKNQNAYDRLSQLQHTDETAREWQVRAALLNRNWSHVQNSLDRLTDEEKKRPKWLYWQARTYAGQGKKAEAEKIYLELAGERSYYGFLAADHIGFQYQFTNDPIALEQDKLNQLLQRPDFKAIEELRHFDRDREMRRQWWYVVSKLNKEQIMIAAKLAQRWGLTQMAIFTIAKAKHWDDLDLRFPIEFRQQIQKNSSRRNLDPAIVFGLIRQESVFNQNARSPAGARGLMQIMPRTGQQIARDLKEKWRSTNVLYSPDVNVKYGTFYYKQLLDRFNGHFALAAAGYNAGPHRVLKWLPKDNPMAADIWIETIPFRETRRYVSTVLANAIVYQQLLGRNSLTMKDFMLDVNPK